MGTTEYYLNTRAALLVQKSAIQELGRMYWYSGILLRTLEFLCCYISYYRKTRAVLVQKSTIGAPVRLCWQSRAL